MRKFLYTDNDMYILTYVRTYLRQKSFISKYVRYVFTCTYVRRYDSLILLIVDLENPNMSKLIRTGNMYSTCTCSISYLCTYVGMMTSPIRSYDRLSICVCSMEVSVCLYFHNKMFPKLFLERIDTYNIIL